jgi:hypothetical protein
MSQRSSVLPSPKTGHLVERLASPFSKQNLSRIAHMMGPTLVALAFAGVSSGVAHAQGTMDFSGATTLMGTFKTFAIYAGAVICLGGLIFAGIRMMSGRFQFTRSEWDQGIRVGNLATIEHIHDDGGLSVTTDSGASLQLTPEQAQHVEYGYAIDSTKRLAVDRVILSGEAEQITAQREALSQLPTRLHELAVYTSDGYQPAAAELAVQNEFVVPAVAEISKLEIEAPSLELEGYAIEM